MATFLERVYPWRRLFDSNEKHIITAVQDSTSAEVSGDLESTTAAMAQLSLSKMKPAQSASTCAAVSVDLEPTTPAVAHPSLSRMEAAQSEAAQDGKGAAQPRPLLIRDSLRSLDKIIQKRHNLQEPLRVYISIDYSIKVSGACETKLLSNWSDFVDIRFSPPSDADLIVVYGDFHESDRAVAFSNVKDVKPFYDIIGEDARCMADSLFVLIENAEPSRGNNVKLHWYTYQT